MRTRYNGILRAHAGLLLAFYTLAVCRALIPGLCATQRALNACPNPILDEDGGYVCCAEAPVPGAMPARMGAAPDGEFASCAFCKLVTTRTQAPAASTDGVQGVGAERPAPIPQTPPALAAPWNPATLRGPPASSLA